jgi:type I restriction enzyme R subunit
VFTKAKLIKDLGNLAVHSTRPILRTDAVIAYSMFARTYGQRSRPAPDLRFAFDLIFLPTAPSTVAVAPTQSIDQLQKLETQLRERYEELSVLLSAKAMLDEELQKLHAEVAAAKKANTAQLDTHDYFIVLLLKAAGCD